MTVRDDQMDALSAVSGSGPAYFYYFTEQLAAAAVELGFTQDQAQQLAERTFLGSAALMHSTGEAPSELTAQLTHPKGTTFRAITAMSNGRLKELFVQAASASMSRAQQIAQETNT
jgi:pyrroline-5-carboxylate reductase